ncbi:fluoride efflux transporter CrcB [Gynuella sp.]|uniref:fluoride efflux transporter CrcB n=1 Tax=Gynuella sp. TaxID=2969146 RepID=UPI003D0A3215
MSPYHWSFLLAVAAGGACGAMCRYMLAQLTRNWMAHGLPVGTLLANIIGSFVMGLAFIWFTLKYPLLGHWRTLIQVGFLGALTTFSSFALESVLLWDQGNNTMALMYGIGSVVGCLLAVVMGIQVGKLFV